MEYQPLEGRDLLVAVREVLVRNPERHKQGSWVRNQFAWQIPVENARIYALKPLPWSRVDETGACGTTACVFGWAAIFSAPAGSKVTDGSIIFSDGSQESIIRWVGPRIGLTESQSTYVASTYRTRDELIDILDALIADPEADIYAYRDRQRRSL